MGWLSFSMHRPVKEWFKDELNSKYELLDAALVKRSTFYATVKNKETGQVFCAVYLIRWSRGYDNFAYKDMDEFCGPNQPDCPKRIMKLLLPLNDENDPNGWAREWRKRVEQYWLLRDAINNGGIIKTEQPVGFTSGNEYQYFRKLGSKTWTGTMIENKFDFLVPVRINFNNFNCEIFGN